MPIKTLEKLEKAGKISKGTLKKFKRTAKGNIPEKVRDKTATLSGDRFPIFDRKSAMSALRLRGHGTTPEERRKIINRAAKFLPAEAKKARKADK